MFWCGSGDGSVDESTTLCSNYRSYIYGGTEWKKTQAADNNIDIANDNGLNIDYVGVCDIMG